MDFRHKICADDDTYKAYFPFSATKILLFNDLCK